MAFNLESINFNQNVLDQIKRTLQHNVKEFAVNTLDNVAGAAQIPTSFKTIWSQIERELGTAVQQTQLSASSHSTLMSGQNVSSLHEQIKAASNYVEAQMPKHEHKVQIAENNGSDIKSQYQISTAKSIEDGNSFKNQNNESSKASFTPWAAGKPSSINALLDFMKSRDIVLSSSDIMSLMYGTGANDDLRDFNKILNADDPIAANNQALGQLFTNSSARINPGYQPRSLSEIAAQSGNLQIREGSNGHQIISARAANGIPLTDIYNVRDGVIGGLTRYGITDADVQSILDNPKVSTDIKDKLKPYLGTGFVTGETNYLLNIKLPNFSSTGVFDQSSWNKSDYLTSS